MKPGEFQKMHDALIAGDPKLRSLRALYTSVFGAYADEARSDTSRKKEVEM
jgi:hypothetical protein